MASSKKNKKVPSKSSSVPYKFVGFDTEGTDKHVATVGFFDESTNKADSFYLDWGNKEDTITKILGAINYIPEGKTEYYKSAIELRKELGLPTSGTISKSQLNKVWIKKIQPKLISPEALAEKMVSLSKQGKTLIGYNNKSYDNPMIKDFFNVCKDLSKTKEGRDILDKAIDIQETLVNLKDKDGTKYGELIRGDINNPKTGPKGSLTLQRQVSLISGKESKGSHTADDDSKNTVVVAHAIFDGNFYQDLMGGLKEVLKGVKNKNKYTHYNDNNDTGEVEKIVLNSKEYNKVIIDYLDNYNKNSNIIKKTPEGVKMATIRKNIDVHDIRGLSSNPSAIKAITGESGVSRMSKYTGISTSALSKEMALGKEIGSTLKELEKLDENLSKNGIGHTFEYDEKSNTIVVKCYTNDQLTNDNYFDSLKIQLEDEKGVIGGKRLATYDTRRLYNDKTGKYEDKLVSTTAQAIMEMNRALGSQSNEQKIAEARATGDQAAIASALKKSIKYIQSGANSVINKNVPLNSSNLVESTEDYFKKDGSDKKATLDAIRSTNVGIEDFIKDVLRSGRVQTALNKEFERQGRGYITVNPYDPSREIVLAMINAFHLAASPDFSEEFITNMDDSQLTKFILQSDAFKTYIDTAKRQGKILPIQYTSFSEGKYSSSGAAYRTSSARYTPFGAIPDTTQRGPSQAYDTMELSETAVNSRQNRAHSVLTTHGRLEAEIEESAEDALYMVKEITQDQFKKAWDEKAEQIGRELGYDENQIEDLKRSALDLEDKILLNKKMKNDLDSFQDRSSRSIGFDRFKSDSFINKVTSAFGQGKSYLSSEEFDTKELELIKKTLGLSKKDLVQGIKQTSDGLQVIYKQHKSLDLGDKVVTAAGDRMITGGFFSRGGKEILSQVLESLGVNDADAVYLKKEGVEERKILSQILPKMEIIAREWVDSGDSLENLLNALNQFSPLFSEIFNIVDGKLEDNLEYDKNTNKYYTTKNGEKIQILDGADGEEQLKNFYRFLTGMSVNGIENPIEQLFAMNKNYSTIKRGKNKGLLREQEARNRVERIKNGGLISMGLHNVYDYQDPIGYGSADILGLIDGVSDDYKVKNARLRNLGFYGRSISENGTEEEKRGLQQLIENQKEADNNYSKRALEAQKLRSQLSQSFRSLTGKETYDTPFNDPLHTGDIEFVTKESLAGVEAKANQIVIDAEETIIELEKLKDENGSITEEAYNNFFMQIARDRKEELAKKDKGYQNANFVLNLKGSSLGGKKYLLADVGPTEDNLGFKRTSFTDSANARLIRSIIEGDEDLFNVALKQTANAYNDHANNKNGALYKTATRTHSAYSAFNVLSTRAITPEEQLYGNNSGDISKKLNTAYMSRKRYESMLKAEKGEDINDYIKALKQNINNLSRQYVLKANNPISEDLKNINVDNQEDITIQELEQIQRDIIKAIADEIESGNNKFTTRVGRYPYTEGYEGNLMRVGFDNSLGEQLQLTLGMAQTVRGDTDGDKVRMAQFISEKYNKDQYLAEQKLLEFYDKFALYQERSVAANKNKENDPIDEQLEQVAHNILNREVNSRAAMEAKQAFANIGMFSNTATNFRESADRLGLRDMSNDATTAFAVDLVSALYEQFEQDAISSKKIYARLIKNNNKDISEEEKVKEAYLQVEKLANLFKEGNLEEALPLAMQLGIFEEGKGNRQFENMRNRWKAAGLESEFAKLSSNFGLGDFGDLSKVNQGVTLSGMSGIFTHVDNAIRSKTGTGSLRDANQYSKLIDPTHRVNGDRREDVNYDVNPYEEYSGNHNSNDGNGTYEDGAIIISGNAVININGQASINVPKELDITGASVTINGNESNAASSNNTTVSQSVKPAEGFVAIKDANGNFMPLQVIEGVNLDTQDGRHTYSGMVDGRLYNSEKDSNFTSVTSLFAGYKPEVKDWDYKVKEAAAIGTFVHGLNELTVNTNALSGLDINSTFEDLKNVPEVLALIEQIGAEYEKGGMGGKASEEVIMNAFRSHYALINAQNSSTTFGTSNNTSVAEVTTGFKIGERLIGGQADLLTFGRDDNGRVTNLSITDWKNSTRGGEFDTETRGERAFQLNAYLLGITQEFKRAKEIADNATDFNDGNLQDIVKKFHLAGTTLGELQQEISDINQILNDPNSENVNLQIVRGFTDKKDGQRYVETVNGKRLSEQEFLSIFETVNNGNRPDYEALSSTLGGSLYFGVNEDGSVFSGNNVVPREIAEENARRSGSTLLDSSDIKSIVKIYRDIEKLQNEFPENERSEGYQQRIDLLNEKLNALGITIERVNGELYILGKNGEELGESDKSLVNLYDRDLATQEKVKNVTAETRNHFLQAVRDESDALLKLAKYEKDVEADPTKEDPELRKALEERRDKATAWVKEFDYSNGTLNGKVIAKEFADELEKHIEAIAAKRAADLAEYTPKVQKYTRKELTDYVSQYRNYYKSQGDLDKMRDQIGKGSFAQDDFLRKQIDILEANLETILNDVFSKYDPEKGTFKGLPMSENDKKELDAFIQQIKDDYNRSKEENDRRRAQEAYDSTLEGKIGNRMGTALNNFIDYGAIALAFQKIRQSMQQLIKTTMELDSAIVNIQIATGYQRDQVKDLMREYSNLAQTMGRTTTEVAAAANDWLRAGYEGAEATELVKASMYLSTLGMMDASKATEALISVLKGWKLESEEVVGVVDKLVQVDMSAAVSAGDIATAMSKVNYSAQNAGISIDTLIGLLTASQEISQQAPESVGNAWRTVIARLQNVKAGKFAASYEDIQSGDYNSEDFTALNDVETVLSTVGISMREGINTWKSAEKILSEVANKWDKFDQVTQSAIANAIAGTRQREQFILAMSNWDSVQAYAEMAQNAYGTAVEKMTAYTDSIGAARKRITAAFEQWALMIDSSGLIKAFYDALATLTENIIGIGLVGALTLLVPIIKRLTKGVELGAEGVETFVDKLYVASNKFGGYESNKDRNNIDNMGRSLAISLVKTAAPMLGMQFGKVLSDQLNLGTAGSNAVTGISTLANIAAGKSITKFIQGGSWTAGTGLSVAAIVGEIIYSIYKGYENKELQRNIDEYSNYANTYSSQKNTYSKLDRLTELQRGTDSTTHTNVSLTDAEYEEFLSLNSLFAETFPKLETETDKLGNIFVNLGDSAEEAAKELEETAKASLKNAVSQWRDDEGASKLFKEEEEKSGADRRIIENDKELTTKFLELNDSVDENNEGRSSMKLHSMELDEELLELGYTDKETTQRRREYIMSKNNDMFDFVYGLDSDQSALFNNFVGSLKATATPEEIDEAGENAKNLIEILSNIEDPETALSGLEILQGNAANFSSLDEMTNARNLVSNALLNSGINLNGRWLYDSGFALNEDGTLTDTKDIRKNLHNIGYTNNTFLNMMTPSQAQSLYGYMQKGILSTDADEDVIARMIRADGGYKNTLLPTQLYLDTKIQRTQELPDMLNNIFSDDNIGNLNKDKIATDFADYGSSVVKQIQDMYEQFTKESAEGETKAKENLQKNIEDLTQIDIKSTLNDMHLIADDMFNDAFGMSMSDMGIDKAMDTFKEFKTVIDEVGKSYDMLTKAQKENAANGGKLTLSTVLDLLSANENYIDVLDITSEGISLKANAEEIMAEAQLRATLVALQESKAMEYQNIVNLENRVAALQSAAGIDIQSESFADNVEILDIETKATNKQGKALVTFVAIAANSIDYLSKIISEFKKNGVSGAAKVASSEFANISKKVTEDVAKSYIGDEEGYSIDELNTLNKYKNLSEDEAYKKLYDILGYGNTTLKEASEDSEYGRAIKRYQTVGNFEEEIKKALNNGTAGNFLTKNGFSTPEKASKLKTEYDKLKEALGALNKEYMQWLSLQEGNTAISSTDLSMSEKYYTQLSKIVERLKEMAKAKLDEMGVGVNLDNIMAIDTSTEAGQDRFDEALSYYKDYMDYQVQINNLGDEQVQDRIKLLEVSGEVTDQLVEEYRALLETADTYEEQLEYEEKLFQAQKKRAEVLQNLLKYQQELLDFSNKYLEGDPFGNKYIKNSEDMLKNLEKQVEQTKESVALIEQHYRDFGSEVLGLAGKELEQYIQEQPDYQSAFKAFLDANSAIGDYYMADFGRKVDYIKQLMNELETSKPQEWAFSWNGENKQGSRMGENIIEYYGEVGSLLKKQQELAQEVLDDPKKMAKLTDEQIKELVNTVNSTTKEMIENNIAMLDELKSQGDTFYNSLTSEVNRYIKNLQDQKDAVNDYYDNEIDKLNDKKDAIARTNELIELQTNLLNANREKERVYREGIGWVNINMPRIKKD